MTNVGDVFRQIGTMLCDEQHPPTKAQREMLNRVLFAVYSGTVESKREQKT